MPHTLRDRSGSILPHDSPCGPPHGLQKAGSTLQQLFPCPTGDLVPALLHVPDVCCVGFIFFRPGRSYLDVLVVASTNQAFLFHDDGA